FIPFGETQEIVGTSLKLRCFEPAHNGCFLKIPELFQHHTLHTTRTCKTPQYSFTSAPFVSCFNFSTAFPQDVSDTSLEFLCAIPSDAKSKPGCARGGYERRSFDPSSRDGKKSKMPIKWGLPAIQCDAIRPFATSSIAATTRSGAKRRAEIS